MNLKLPVVDSKVSTADDFDLNDGVECVGIEEYTNCGWEEVKVREKDEKEEVYMAGNAREKN